MTEDKPLVAYFSGLIQGWAIKLTECQNHEEVLEVVNDMKIESNRLAKYAGVDL